MLTIRWILASVLLLGKYATGTSIAEEINFEVSNMKESAKNDLQVDVPQETAGNEEETGKDNFENAETSPSEIVETHVLPEESEPEEVNAQMKRSRRRRRRRRRKRPKPVTNTEELEPYYTIPEDEIKRKPIKYRPQENVDVLVLDSTNVPRRRNTKRRRRPLKRPVVEDYPMTGEGTNPEYVNSTEEHVAESANNDQPEEGREKHKMKIEYKDENDDSHVAKVEIDHQQLFLGAGRKVHKKIKENERENAPPSKISDSKTQNSVAESELSKPSTSDDHHRKGQKHQNEENEFNTVRPQEETLKSKGQNVEAESATKILPYTDNHKLEDYHKETEALKYFDELNGTVRKRKRPYFKGEYPAVGAEVAKEVASERTPSEAAHGEFKDLTHGASRSEIKIAGARETASKFPFVDNHKMKHEDRPKANDTNKKEVFKLRRLPPISAILRHVKVRPVKNETIFARVPVKNETLSTLKGNVSNEILTHMTLNNVHTLPQNETTEEEEVVENGTLSTIMTVDVPHQQPTTRDPINYPSTSDDFEFPIIIYTEQKHSQTEASIPGPAVSQAASSTETTAFIYIPCNQTAKEVTKSTLNFAADVNVTTTTITSINSTENGTERTVTSSADPQNDTFSILGSLAMEELEKLLQRTEVENMYLNNATEMRNNTKMVRQETLTTPTLDQVDAGALETHLNYIFQNKTNMNSSRLPFLTEPKEVKLSTEEINYREPKWFQDTYKNRYETNEDGKYDIPFAKSYTGSSKELVISYTSTTSGPSSAFNEIDAHETIFRENELSLHLRNNTFRRRVSQDGVMHKKNHTERKKLPLAVKSAIIISGAILALAVLGFFVLLLSCKIRQAKSRMKCHRELYREQFQNSEFRQSSRSTSPVVSKSNYNGRSFTNNIQSNVASNRNYYLWQTLRKTFQYD